MEETDIHALSLLIKAHANLTIIFEATSRLLKELTDLTQELGKQDTTAGNHFSKN